MDITEPKNSILIVDDEKTNLMYLNHILGADYLIYTAREAPEALERANQYQPDLILLDIIMPGMDGYEVLTSLKKNEKTKAIPVIFITGLGSSEDEMRGLILGAEDYITKPFSDAIVKLRVRNQIKMVNQMRAIEHLSMIDQLTDIPNRRNFNQRIEIEWRRAVRNQTPISLLMIDVDKFKVFNDTYGHQQGDVVLQTVACSLKKSMRRPADFASRWGGEEFAILLPSTEASGALSIAEGVREEIERTAIPRPGGEHVKVTVSIGVNSLIPSQDDSMDDFILKADKALYTAKETGRNRVCKAI